MTAKNINPAEFRLLIHHHDIAYQENPAEIWLSAGIARWVSALACYFNEIGLLLHQSADPLPKQDEAITERNVKLVSLGPPGHYWDHFSRMKRIRTTVRRAEVQADGLLIRGITPRQYTVWKSTPVYRKAFLLVRSPRQNRIVRRTAGEIVSEIINRFREREYREIAKSGTLLMVNSPVYLPEIEAISKSPVYFAPTNTIRACEFAPLAVKEISTPTKLLYCGRLTLLKGLQELFEAVAYLNNKGRKCEVDLVGAKEEPIYTNLLDFANQLGIGDHIHWHGRIPFGPHLFEFYRTADVFVLPTYTEGFPRVLWEAAANCCPIITTAVGGIPALFMDGEHALLIPPKNVQAIVDAVNRITSDRLLQQRLVAQAYQHAKGFTVEACAEKLKDILLAKWAQD